MQNVPKIVVDRLKAVAAAQTHPDADLLTAFSEQALPGPERAIVLNHLARCGDCREIVALTLPESERALTDLRPWPGRWFTWPVLRWGFVAAGVIAIASFGVVQYQRQSRLASQPVSNQPTEARNQPEPPPASAEADLKRDEGKPLGASASTSGVVEPKQALTATSRRDAQQSSALTAQNGVREREFTHVPLTHGPNLPEQWQQNSNQMNANTYAVQAPASAPAMTLPLAKPQAPVPARVPPPPSPAVDTQQPARDEQHSFDTLALRNQPMEQPSTSGHAEGEINRAKQPDPVVGATVQKSVAGDPETYGGPATAKSGVNGRGLAQLATLSPSTSPLQWSINSSGRLQRSLDQGSTWQDVDVNRSTGSSGATAEFAMAKTARAKTAEKEQSLKKEATTPVFRAVAANGLDVWAGGSNGLLYHSIDAGGHWTRVVPSSPGASLTGDIVSVAFTDAQHGSVTTSASDVWTTSDAGQTWQKQ